MSVKLTLAASANLPAGVAAPRYRRADLKPGILHIGVGNFHRAHQAVYLDDLFNAGHDHDWALVGAGVREPDVDMRAKLQAQDWLTTVVEQEADAATVRVTGAMIDFVTPFDVEANLAALARPEIRIVSLTVTEGGYYISPATQRFDPAHPEIVYDAAHPDTPKTAFGLIAAGLKRRRAAGLAPFTVMSCDNIPGNGHVTESAVAGLAELSDPEFARWIRANVAFPNSMVDRITPATTDRERAILRDSYGVDDAWPVFCETFRQWVIEDKFPAGRPALEKVGVTFTGDVAPYELMKIRILNGGHAAIAYPAGLLDIHFVHEAMEDAQIAAFLETLTKREIIPVVPPPPQVDLEAYRQKVAERFANPKIGDTISRLCLDGSNRQPKFILPTARDRIAAGASVEGLALVSALWCRYAYGESESGKVIPPNDPAWDRLQAAARPARDDPRAFLAMGDIFGDLADNPVYVAAFSDALGALWANGVRATLAGYLERGA
ncbi:mannitol 2-dehydrogenase [Roseiarcus fermentans]|uniref:Mannitol 2-dehydrogenase n=1 Tax=Roseiarcus fermentans TaxID=1473586 RepID=A0A366FNC4_9HYPH|nr:mannitol dehydrogenase family protein [Roseiarcus fermentans]RBP16128.1 mannitol 2-dehydrogenase [Roseiarcus fermentans]